MKIINVQVPVQFVEEVPVVQIDANWFQIWKFKRAWKRVLKEQNLE